MNLVTVVLKALQLMVGRECDLQCANTESGYPIATFEIEYNNNSFSSPKLVEKFTS